jgi:hypothetical protein
VIAAERATDHLRELKAAIDTRVPTERLEGKLEAGATLGHGRQLEEIATEYELQPAKGGGVVAHTPRHLLQLVEQLTVLLTRVGVEVIENTQGTSDGWAASGAARW